MLRQMPQQLEYHVRLAAWRRALREVRIGVSGTVSSIGRRPLIDVLEKFKGKTG